MLKVALINFLKAISGNHFNNVNSRTLLTFTLRSVRVRSSSLLTRLTLCLSYISIDAVLADLTGSCPDYVTVSSDGTQGAAHLS